MAVLKRKWSILARLLCLGHVLTFRCIVYANIIWAEVISSHCIRPLVYEVESQVPVDLCIFLYLVTGWCACYLQLCARFKLVFLLMLTFKRSCSSALNAMLTTCGTSGNAPNCREESDISDTRVEPGGLIFYSIYCMTGKKEKKKNYVVANCTNPLSCTHLCWKTA